MGKNTKIDQIMIATKLNIEVALADKTTLAQKADFLGMNISDLSKVLNLKVLLSLQKIIDIENKLGAEILIPVFPSHEKILEAQTRKHLVQKQVHGVAVQKLMPDLLDNDDNRIPDTSTYTSIKKISKFNDSIDPLLKALRDNLEPIAEEANHIYTERMTEQYISINLIPDKKKIGGFHICWIRLYPKTPKLVVEFIVQNIQFEQQLEKFSQRIPKLEKGTTENITNVPEKRRRSSFLGTGLPNFTFISGLTESNIKDIVDLAKDVYFIQAGK